MQSEGYDRFRKARTAVKSISAVVLYCFQTNAADYMFGDMAAEMRALPATVRLFVKYGDQWSPLQCQAVRMIINIAVNVAAAENKVSRLKTF